MLSAYGDSGGSRTGLGMGEDNGMHERYESRKMILSGFDDRKASLLEVKSAEVVGVPVARLLSFPDQYWASRQM
jgi:hypothetical protein